MTSNGNNEVNQSTQNQQNKAPNGVSQMKCGGLMVQSASTARKTNRNIHNMAVKRPRSVDPSAGMCIFLSSLLYHRMDFFFFDFHFFVHTNGASVKSDDRFHLFIVCICVFLAFSFRHSKEKIESKQWHSMCATAKKYGGHAQWTTARTCL